MSKLERLSPVVRGLPPSGIRRFFDLASQMKDVISLGVGEPDFVTPWRVREAAVYALERGFTSYTSNYGLPALREAIAEYLEGFDLHYDPAHEILVTLGGSESIDLALRTLVCPGDEVLIPEPTYVSYRPCAILAGATPVAVPTTVEDEFRLAPDRLRAAITPRTKALVLCYPNNPTGAILTEEDVQAIARIVMEHDLFVVSDEIYAELTYGRRHVSIAAVPGMKERTIVINGMSKAFAMTGWRIGYCAAPRDLIEEMVKIHQYTIMCAPSMGQVAAVEALRHGQADKDRMVEKYDQRRRLIVKGLNDIGLRCHEPRGAFYAFPDIRSTGLSSEEFAERLLAYGVAVVPGNVFGAAGEGFVRCSYATSAEQIERALERMARFVQAVRPV
ncbi:aminotransferase [Alicyclobacillus cellulosilyticus]|uniref:Aminotransferase n=1 Tax=Alicyclobacillus cellulosilyticus TaxID=1003997 RepID=A0A917K971_9BACL|nr:aminotransferase class I/II-fold pyridoxal phosphate-dependent enzyme [Alicyclobacillus cellulosilyticus]GGJ02338.1 aminotransferase [Alicyclobacillus cellulosilyticus]